MAVTQDEITILTKIVGRFENEGDPYKGVTGDFDGMGISCGVLQWNIGSNSLQPLVRAVGKTVVGNTMPTFGDAMWNACNGTIAQGLAIVRKWQTNNRLLAKPAAELRALLGSPDMRAQQNQAIAHVATKADTLAAEWATARGKPARTLQELIWFFDIVTQNGSMKDVSFADVKAFKDANTPDKSDDVVCKWLAGLNQNFWGFKDSNKNAVLWKNNVAPADLDLFILAYLRSQRSKTKARGDVMNRKGTLATRKGWVHQTRYDFSDLF
jgi:hypothetical protein